MSLMRSAVLSLCATAVFSASALAQNTWQPYQFNGTEKFAYDITYTQAGQLKEGQLTLDFAQEDGRTWLTIDGAVGDMSCSGRSPMDNAQAAQQALMMQCFTMAPILAAVYTPVWGMFMGRSWELGSQWSMGSGDQGVSFEVTDTCAYAGVEGLLAVIVTQGNRMESCVATDVALPLAMSMEQNDFSISIALTEFRR